MVPCRQSSLFVSLLSQPSGRGSASREDDLVASVQTPSDAVELQVRLIDLSGRSDGEEIETLDLVLHAADSSELPVPQNLVAVGNVDFESVDPSDGRRVEDSFDVHSFADEGRGSELHEIG